MRTRPSLSFSAPMLVLATVAALVLGTLGTATAAGLTKGKVKKIAAKVVQKSAPGLSVAHATAADTAANATNLQGQPASQYKNPAYRFVLPVQAAAPSRTYTFPGVPAGSYLVGYSVFATMTANSVPIVCQLRANTTSPWENFSGGAEYAPGNFTTQGTAVLQLTGATPELFCTSPGASFTIYSASNYLSTVTYTRVDGITNGTVTSARADGDGAPQRAPR